MRRRGAAMAKLLAGIELGRVETAAAMCVSPDGIHRVSHASLYQDIKSGLCPPGWRPTGRRTRSWSTAERLLYWDRKREQSARLRRVETLKLKVGQIKGSILRRTRADLAALARKTPLVAASDMRDAIREVLGRYGVEV